MPNFAFHNLVVRSFTLDHLTFAWEVEPTELDPWDYDWYVERSEGPAGPWDRLAGPFSDRYLFIDHQVSLLHRWRTLFYRLKSVRKLDTTDIEYSAVVNVAAEPDLEALEIRRLEELGYRQFTGRVCWLFPARTFGQHCPSCWNEVLHKRTRGNCPTCYDTGWAGGYMHPIECYIQIDPAAKRNQEIPTGEVQHSTTQARMSAFPPVKPKDIIVEAENLRWRVDSVGSTQKRRATIRQEMTLVGVVPGDVEFQLPIQVEDPLTLQMTDERNFEWTPH